MVAAEHTAETAEAGDHLVCDQEHVVLTEHGLDPLLVGAWGRYDTARAEDRLGDEGGHSLRPFRFDERLETLGTMSREFGLASEPERPK
jgi:hypothetical protein